jgi:WD40 repeat protein
MPVGLDHTLFDRYRTLFDRYRDVLCDMTTPDGAVSERFRQALREACQPSVRFVQAAAWSGHAQPVRSIAFSSDGGQLASADDQGIRLWEARTGDGRVLVVGGLGPTWPVAFNVDGRVATAAKGIPGVQLWNSATGALVRCLGGHERIRSVAFSADGTWVATGGDDQSARVWTADLGKPAT